MIATLTIAAAWTAAGLALAFTIGAVITLAKARDCCPHEADVPGYEFAGWVTV